MEPDKMELERLRLQAADAARELWKKARVPRDGIVVVGCSTSEVVGGIIGKASSMQAAAAIYRGIAPRAGAGRRLPCRTVLRTSEPRRHCRARAALKPWQQPVNVLPQPHAGGSFATTAWQSMKAPAALEEIEADAGLDIGGTLIGIHLKRVAVPVRLSVRRLGQANLVAARTRPKFIGGARAAYLPEEELR